jgi:hypothetical protein
MPRLLAIALGVAGLTLAGCGQPPSTPPPGRDRAAAPAAVKRSVVTPAPASAPSGPFTGPRPNRLTTADALDDLLTRDLPAEDLVYEILHLEGDS